MTTFEAIQKIKQMFAEAGELPAVEMQEPAPSDAPLEAQKEYVLASGAKVMIDKLEIGGKVQLLDEAGNLAPAPQGEHMLVDGTKIVLDEAGLIVEIESPKAEVVEEVLPEAAPAPSMEEEMKKKMEEMAAEIAELKKQYKEKMAAQEQRFSKGISDLSDVVIELINTSSAKPTEAPKEKFNVHIESKDSKLERFLEFAKSIK